MLSRLVDIRFQRLFTPLAGVLFTFPSRYWFTIGRQVVFSLGRWSSRIPAGFLGSRSTQVPHHRGTDISLTGLSPSLAGLPRPFDYVHACSLCGVNAVTPMWSYNPSCTTPARLTYTRFGLVRVRSPLLAESRLISVPEGTEMFHFPSFATEGLCIQPSVSPT